MGSSGFHVELGGSRGPGRRERRETNYRTDWSLARHCPLIFCGTRSLLVLFYVVWTGVKQENRKCIILPICRVKPSVSLGRVGHFIEAPDVLGQFIGSPSTGLAPGHKTILSPGRRGMSAVNSLMESVLIGTSSFTAIGIHAPCYLLPNFSHSMYALMS